MNKQARSCQKINHSKLICSGKRGRNRCSSFFVDLYDPRSKLGWPCCKLLIYVFEEQIIKRKRRKRIVRANSRVIVGTVKASRSNQTSIPR